MEKHPDLRKITIDTYGKPIRKGPNGEEYWTCYVVPFDDTEQGDSYYVYIFEDEKHKLFDLVCSNLNAGPCDHWIKPEPVFVGENIWDLYNQMGEHGIFRKREDGIGYYHYK